jgi:hypothetical protein
MTVEVHPVTDRASWLARRTQDVTASDVAPLAGVGPKGGRTAYRVYLEKAGLITPDEADSNLMWRGRLLEPAVIAAVAEREPEWTIKPAGVYVRDSVIRLGATPDAVALNPKRPGIGNIECKVVSRPVFEEHWRADDGSVRPPLYYQLQTLAQATLMDAQWSQLAALVIATFSVELFVIDIDRHEPAETRIRNISASFGGTSALVGSPLRTSAGMARLSMNFTPRCGVPWSTCAAITDCLLRSPSGRP